MKDRPAALMDVDPPDEVPSTVRLADQLCFALYAATNTITRTYRPLLEPLGITYPQYLVLLIIWEDRTPSVSEIADRLHLPAHAISPMIDRLQTNGLVERTADELDGRRVLVKATAKGVALETGAAAAWDKVRCQTQLDWPELVQMRSQLMNLVDRMQDT